jgi:phosphatidylethanolamine/phosphatidyl-N-methylethanolamine N-methyltransferase
LNLTGEEATVDKSPETSQGQDWKPTKVAQHRYDVQDVILELVPESWRRLLWSKVGGGRVLEVGVGTGMNMVYYPPEAAVVAVDPSPSFLTWAANRARKTGKAAGLGVMDVRQLALADDSFDCAATSFVFCSVPDPIAGLTEVRRVLKPGGRFILLEHVRLGNRLLGRLMDLLNPPWLRLSGDNINRDTVANVRRAGFQVVAVDSFLGGLVKVIEARKGSQ